MPHLLLSYPSPFNPHPTSSTSSIPPLPSSHPSLRATRVTGSYCAKPKVWQINEPSPAHRPTTLNAYACKRVHVSAQKVQTRKLQPLRLHTHISSAMPRIASQFSGSQRACFFPRCPEKITNSAILLQPFGEKHPFLHEPGVPCSLTLLPCTPTHPTPSLPLEGEEVQRKGSELFRFFPGY